MSRTNTAEDLASIADELVWPALTELPNGPREQSGVTSVWWTPTIRK